MSYQFKTTPTFSNQYVAYIVNNIDFIITLTKNKRLDKEIPQDNSRTRNYDRPKTPTLEYCQVSKYNEQSTSIL